jgi:glycosyltransferase involved in cell wall biosynthesis
VLTQTMTTHEQLTATRDRRMRVMFLITAQSTGLGGHLFSLRSLVGALGEHVDCSVVNVGTVPAEPLKSLSVPCAEVLFDRPKILARLGALSRIVRRFEPDVLHAFDANSFFFARVVGWRFNKPVVHTKCGGANPVESYFPRAENLVLFSVENQEFFAAHPKHREARIKLIPNRVDEVKQNPTRIARVREGLVPGALLFLRIGRLAPAYEPAALQTIALVKRLYQDGIRASFVQIGVVHVRESAERIRAALGEEDRLLTEPEYTRNASEMIDAADFVVGTGRSFMEAASRRRVLLAPLADGEHPALVTPGNWSALFRTNFSPRGEIPGFDIEQNYHAILEAARSPERRDELAAFSRGLFDEHFSIRAAVPTYLQLYRDVKPARRHHPLDTAMHGLKVFRSLRATT